MKKIYALMIAAAFCWSANAQTLKPVAQKVFERKSQQISFVQSTLFEVNETTIQRSAHLKSIASDAVVLNFRQSETQNILSAKPENINFIIPTNAGINIELELFRSTIFTPDFSVITSTSNNQAVPYENGVHYWGIIKGDNSSLAAISIFNDEVMGMISSDEGNLVLGKLENDANSLHVIYNDKKFNAKPLTECFTPSDNGTYSPKDLQNPATTLMVNCIRLYWEVNYDIYQGKGSVTAATNYVTGLFNQSAIIFTNDNIPVELSQVLVWNVTSPYTSTSTSGLLGQFQGYRNSFNGDLGHLLGYAGGGGVAAGFNGLCASNLDNSQCYSGISSSYQNLPTYSWSVMVATHEQGHLMGSRHTHACVWNGNNTAIDNCGPTAGYGYEGSCSGAPTPVGGGTIMSYCHLVGGVGINFNNGFGTQPKNAILAKYNAASCLVACGGVSCGTPNGLGATNIAQTSATLNWGAVTGATSYNLQYKQTALPTWTTVNGIAVTTYNVAGLTNGTAYHFQVQAVCASGSSSYSTPFVFTTTLPPCNVPSGLSSSVISSSSALVSWGAVAGAVSYTLQYYVTGTQNFNTLTGLVNTSYTITGLVASTNYSYRVLTVCTGSSSSYSSTSVYTTYCADNYEPNNSGGTAASITFNTDTYGLISPTGDIDFFKFSNTASQPNIRMTLTNLPANYNLRLTKNGVAVANSTNSGTTSETIIYNTTTVGSYRARVWGASGANSISNCYTLKVEISNTPFRIGNSDNSGLVNSQSGITIYPNPADESILINIDLEDVDKLQNNIIISDMVGKIFFNSSNAQLPAKIDLSKFASGVYFVKVVRGESVFTKKLVVAH